MRKSDWLRISDKNILIIRNESGGISHVIDDKDLSIRQRIIRDTRWARKEGWQILNSVSPLVVLAVRLRSSALGYAKNVIGPCPIHEVVVMAVRKAVSAATTTFTAISTNLFFMV